MPRLSRSRRDCVVLAALAFAVALAQRPGTATSDTKIDLHVDPVGFLADVASVWSPTGDLGHVQGGQYTGYLFPMGPVFALGHWLGLAPWLIHRLWLGLVLVIAVVGAARLVDALLPGGGTPARLAAGAVMLLNPYVVVFANRTSITLLAYALLPWMLLTVHRGLRHPRNWWWPAACALIVAAAGGGVNAAVIAWLLLAPAALLLYEPLIGAAAWRDAWRFGWRAGACLAVTSLWWVAPVAVQALYGRDFLPFTEQPGVIWGTTSASEVLRLMGYWTSYIGVGYTGTLGPYTSDAGVMLFHPAVVVATLLVPALVALGLLVARRWAYGPFFLGLLIAGTLVVMVGFPDGTPLRRAALAVYFHFPPVQFLRTSYKAAPLIVVAFALLAAAAAPVVWARARWLGAAAALAVLVLSAWPLVRGQAIDSQLTWDRIPPAWTDAAQDLDASLPENTRAVVLPAQLFATYDWGTTVDPLLPALTDRPVAARTAVPYADRRAVDLLWTTDALVQQERVIPGQLVPLLRYLGAGAVIAGADDARRRSGAIVPAGGAQQLRLGGLGRRAGSPGGEAADTAAPSGAVRSYGAVRRRPAEAGTLAPARRLAEVRRYDVAGGPGIVRVQPAAPQMLVDGSASTVAGLAALGALDRDLPFAYAADRSTAELRAAARTGAELVIGDGNRRQVMVASRTRQEVGPVLAAGEDLPSDAAVLDPLEAGTRAQTVAEYDGIRAVRDDFIPAVTQFPEHRPFAAIDGDDRTSWISFDHADLSRHWLEVDFTAPRDVPFVDLLPHADARARTTAVEIAGKRYPLKLGWNRLRLGLRDVESLRVRIATVERAPGVPRAGGGIDELRIPGVSAREWLRPPRVLEDALRGADLDRSALSYVFQRQTGATPFRRDTAPGPAEARLVRDRGDAEQQLARRISPPAARSFRADGWVSVAGRAPDPALDAIAGTRGGPFASSGRFEGHAGRRASRAFDGDPSTAWIAPWDGRAWIEWTTPERTIITNLTLAPVAGVRQPASVRLSGDGGTHAEVDVTRDGHADFTSSVRGRHFRLEVTAARFPDGTPGRIRQRRAMGIAEITNAGATARDAAPRDVGRGAAAGGDAAAGGGEPAISAPCGSLRVLAGGQTLRLRPVGSVAAFDAGRPLRARPCGDEAALPAGTVDVTTASTVFAPYWLRLRSDAPAGAPAPVGGGEVVDPGELGRSEIDGVRLAVDGPARLVLAEGYDRGWRAWCDDRALGAPQADGPFNGWAVTGPCTTARFAYAPDKAVRLALIVSGGACLLAFVVLLLVGRPATREVEVAGFGTGDDPPRTSWGRAAAVGLAVGVAAAFLIALRAGPPVALGVALITRYGVGARPLIVAAAALLGIVVPAAYLLFEPTDKGGYAFSFATDLVGAHWVATAALVLLALALWRIVSARRPARSARATRGPAAAARDPEPAA
ncbi:MAG TPA: alpha-(1-_3)-arabinofuranosyltransferase family protein [Solirubrobacteraceae bacterium]|nr:alpha-(1->3)-arabinofuranosyltransferase family protein [Solirubrobacteraceae bacterium]